MKWYWKTAMLIYPNILATFVLQLQGSAAMAETKLCTERLSVHVLSYQYSHN